MTKWNFTLTNPLNVNPWQGYGNNGWLAQQRYLNLGLDILNSVARLHLKSDGLARQCLDKDLHATSQTKDQVQGRLFLDVVVTEGATIFQLLASKDQTLLVGWNALLVLFNIEYKLSHIL